MKILIAEAISPSGLEILRGPGWTVDVRSGLSSDELAEIIGSYEALIVRSQTRVTSRVIAAAERLKVIGRAGAGVDTIDLEAATARGILVMNTPGSNSVSVAEHTFGLILCVMRHIAAANMALKRGEWDRQAFLGRELRGKTLGVIGLGKVGQEVAKRAKAFGMTVIAHDPFISERLAHDLDVRLVALDELLRTSDIVSLHASLTRATRRMINRETLSRMKPGAILINTARGELVDEEALLESLETGRIAGAGLDVFAHEPPRDRRLLEHPRVVATPHVGASTLEAQEQVGVEIALQVRDYLQSGIVRNAVNFPAISPEEFQRLMPFLELGERLGAFLAQIARVRAVEVGIRYYGELIHLNISPISNAVLCGLLRQMLDEDVNLINARMKAEERGLELIETRSTRARGYANLISVQLRDGQGGVDWVEGTVAHAGNLRLVSLDGVSVDVPLSPHMLLVRNEDVPGVIGRIGTILGDAQVNIGNFALARHLGTPQPTSAHGSARAWAVGILTVDSPVPAPVLEAIRQIPSVTDVRAIFLS